MSGTSSYRVILRSSSIIAGAQVIGILCGILRMKAAAVLLGPAGVGLIGLYLNLMQSAASVASLGMAGAGTRQIASAGEDEAALARVRRALFLGSLGLALIGALLFWLASGWLAERVLADASRAPQLRWLSAGVALTVLIGYQGALLTGLRRIKDLAQVTIGAAVAATAFGLIALWLWGEAGLMVMVLAAPAASLLIGLILVARLGLPHGPRLGLTGMIGEWRGMLRLGLALMLSGVVTLLGHLAARLLVQRELGPEALGQFQAAWTIGMTYLGFVLAAMSTDYFPRLSAAIHDPARACRMVNEQIEVSLLLCAPVLLALLGCAPWVIRLLYSTEFGPAVEILRWQLLGDILKVVSWPLGSVIAARGAGASFVLTESLGIAALLGAIWIGLPLIGIAATGVAFLAMYGLYLPLVWWFGGRPIGFRWSRTVKLQAMALILSAILVDLTSRWSDLLGATLGLTLALAFGLFALTHLSHLGALGGRIGRLATALATRAPFGRVG